MSGCDCGSSLGAVVESILVDCAGSSRVSPRILEDISMLKVDQSDGEVVFCRVSCWKEIRRSDGGMQCVYL